MTDEWRWFLDTDVQVAGFCITTLIVAFRVLSRAIKDGDDRLADMIRTGDDALHSRINQVRDEYVRRDDVRELREDLKETNKRLDQLMSMLAKER